MAPGSLTRSRMAWAGLVMIVAGLALTVAAPTAGSGPLFAGWLIRRLQH